VFWRALRNNVTWTVLSLTVTCGLGLILAIVLNTERRGKVFYRSVFYFPYLLSGIIVALIWGWIYHPMFGLLHNVLIQIGLPDVNTAWLGRPQSAIFAVFVAFAWHVVGFQMILFLAGLQTIPPEPYESATIDGANWFQMLVRITLPLLRETYIIVVATTIIGSFKIYDIVVGMTKGGPAYATQVLALWMYDKSFYYYNAGEGATVAVVLTAVIAVIAIPYIRFMFRREYY
jgi:raffinose/stachyose/melibiose transport system permease protein